MPTSETDLTQDLIPEVCKLLTGAVVLNHSDKYKTGIPDLSVTWRWVTSWWEIKYYDNRMFKSPPLQELTCKWLARQGVCFYVIYEWRRLTKGVRIVHPNRLSQWESRPRIDGYRHDRIAEFIKRAHVSMRPPFRREEVR